MDDGGSGEWTEKKMISHLQDDVERFGRGGRRETWSREVDLPARTVSISPHTTAQRSLVWSVTFYLVCSIKTVFLSQT